MYCTRCGTTANNKRFCTQCGFKLSKVPRPADRLDSIFFQKTLQEVHQNQPVDPLVGRTIDRKYYLESRLGIGGMGAVYRAKRLQMGDEAAIKILNPEHAADPRAVERFRREATIGASLRHPNAVTVYDFGVSQDRLIYFVMELVEGNDLRSLILQTGQMSQSVAVEILVQACAALDEAHRKNVVHRDLKPENILVQSTPTGQRVKILDFGIASMCDFAGDKLTQTGGVVGTPHYMSPEQCMGEEVDGRSDIYSLGIILFEMLAGMAPFNSTTPTAIAVQQVSKTPPSLRDRNPKVSPEVEAVVMRTLRKLPEDRPQTASALAQELLAAVKCSQPMLIDHHAAVEEASDLSNFGSNQLTRKSNALGQLAISLVFLLTIAAGFGLWRLIKNDRNREQLTASVVTQSDPAAAPTPQAKIDQPINPNPDEPSEKPVPNVETNPSLPSDNQAVKRKVVDTKKRIAANRQAIPKKAANPEREYIGYYRDRRMMIGDDDRYGRYRYNSFGPDDRDRFRMRRRYRGYYR